MLGDKNKAFPSTGNLTFLSCKFCEKCFSCFDPQHGRFVTWLQASNFFNQYRSKNKNQTTNGHLPYAYFRALFFPHLAHVTYIVALPRWLGANTAKITVNECWEFDAQDSTKIFLFCVFYELNGKNTQQKILFIKFVENSRIGRRGIAFFSFTLNVPKCSRRLWLCFTYK